MTKPEADRPFDESLPEQYRLKHIRSGYRRETNKGSCGDVLASAVTCHNESGNIFTHLLAFMMFVGCLVLVITQVDSAQKHSNAARALSVVRHRLDGFARMWGLRLGGMEQSGSMDHTQDSRFGGPSNEAHGAVATDTSPNVTSIPALGGMVDTASRLVCFSGHDEAGTDTTGHGPSCTALPEAIESGEVAGLSSDRPSTGLAAYWEGIRKGADNTIHAFEERLETIGRALANAGRDVSRQGLLLRAAAIARLDEAGKYVELATSVAGAEVEGVLRRADEAVEAAVDAATLALDARLGTHLTMEEARQEQDREQAQAQEGGGAQGPGAAGTAEVGVDGSVAGEVGQPSDGASHDGAEDSEGVHGGLGTRRRLSRWPLVVFVLSAMVCLGCSVTYHLFYVVSEEWFGFLQRLDYSGIAVLIFGSNMPPLQYLYYCRPEERTIFTVVSLVSCAGCLCMGLLEFFRHARWQAPRAGVFVLTGLVGGVAVVYGWQLSAAEHPEVREALWSIVIMGGLYVGGAALYALHIPERWSQTGYFDLVGNSHNIFHVFVGLAALLHFRTSLLLFDWRREHLECPADGYEGLGLGMGMGSPQQ